MRSGQSRVFSISISPMVFFVCVTVVLCAFHTAFSKNPIWVGEIENISLAQLEDGKMTISLVMKEDVTDGKYEPFEPANMFFINFLEGGKKARIIIDGLGPGEYEGKAYRRTGMFSSGKVNTLRGSYSNRNLQLTESGKQIWSSEIAFESEKPMDFMMSKATEENSTYTLAITFFDKEKFGTDREDVGDHYDTIEITADEFDEPPTTAMSLEGIGPDEWVEKVRESLQDVNKDEFVTLVYPVMHLDPNTAVNLVRHKLSVLGSMIVNMDTSSIIITDVAEYAKAIAQTLALIDTKTPQVLIEVKIVEVSWDEELQAGIDWNWINPGANNQWDITSLTAAPGNDGGLSATVNHLSGGDLQTFITKINAFMQKGKAKLLARPKIIVLNNKSASFHAGSSIPYFRRTSVSRNRSLSDTESEGEDSSTSATYGTGTEAVTYQDNLLYFGPFLSESESRSDSSSTSRSETGSTSLSEGFSESYVNTGIRLSVTPRIRNSGEVILDIQPSVDEVVGYRTINSAPILSSRSVQSTVRVGNGETIVIGGLFREHEIKSKGGVPILKDIPIAGLIFSRVRTEKRKTEIVFVLTTHLIK